jgi:hypothetical protein
MNIDLQFKNKKGMTLIEVVVSAVVLALIVVSVIAMMMQSSVFSRRIDDVYISNNLAKKRLDDLKRYLVSDLADIAVEMDVRIDENGDIDANGDYIRDTDVVENYDSNPFLVQVTVSVDKYVDGAEYGSPAIIETLFADIE